VASASCATTTTLPDRGFTESREFSFDLQAFELIASPSVGKGFCQGQGAGYTRSIHSSRPLPHFLNQRGESCRMH